MIALDHIAVTAPQLELGIKHVLDQTGLTLPKGGQHVQMATHNALCRFSDDTYFEIITPDQAANPPTRPRWFDLDTVSRPGLSAWILRTDDIDRCIALAAEMGIDLGSATPFKRDALRWQFSLRDDGSIPLRGAAPLIIQWQGNDAHPAGNMADLGVGLKQLQIATPEHGQLRALLERLGMENLPEIIHGDRVKITATLTLADGREAILT